MRRSSKFALIGVLIALALLAFLLVGRHEYTPPNDVTTMPASPTTVQGTVTTR